MRISDWSSDVCSSDLKLRVAQAELDRMRSDAQFFAEQIAQIEQRANWLRAILPRDRQLAALREQADEIRDAIASAEASISNMQDRKSGVAGKRVSVRVDTGGRRILKKKKKTNI